MHFELFPQLQPVILEEKYSSQKQKQSEQFPVTASPIVRDYRNQVVQALEQVEGQVVHEDRLLNVQSMKDSQVLQVYPSAHQDAVRPIESYRKQLAFRVDDFHDRIRIVLLAGCEKHQVEHLGRLLEELLEVRAEVQIPFDFLDVYGLWRESLGAGEDESFVQIQNQVSLFIDLMLHDIQVYFEGELRVLCHLQSLQHLNRVEVVLQEIQHGSLFGVQFLVLKVLLEDLYYIMDEIYFVERSSGLEMMAVAHHFSPPLYLVANPHSFPLILYDGRIYVFSSRSSQRVFLGDLFLLNDWTLPLLFPSVGVEHHVEEVPIRK